MEVVNFIVIHFIDPGNHRAMPWGLIRGVLLWQHLWPWVWVCVWLQLQLQLRLHVQCWVLQGEWKLWGLYEFQDLRVLDLWEYLALLELERGLLPFVFCREVWGQCRAHCGHVHGGMLCGVLWTGYHRENRRNVLWAVQCGHVWRQHGAHRGHVHGGVLSGLLWPGNHREDCSHLRWAVLCGVLWCNLWAHRGHLLGAVLRGALRVGGHRAYGRRL